MHWQAVETMPISVAHDTHPPLAHAMQQALVRRAVPLAVLRAGRSEPLATAALLVCGPGVVLVTAAHALDAARADELAVALVREGRLVSLCGAAQRVLVHPQGDVAVLRIRPGALADRLLANWVPLSPRELLTAPGDVQARLHVVVGYPSAQMLRADGVLYARPVVLFTVRSDPQCFAYGRVARRLDGRDVHTPELDGVSGATVWAVQGSASGEDCRLSPVALQVAFRHGRHLRTEPIGRVTDLLQAILQ